MGYLSNYIENYRKADKPSFQLFNWTKRSRDSFDLSIVEDRLALNGRLIWAGNPIDLQSIAKDQQYIRNVVLKTTKQGV